MKSVRNKKLTIAAATSMAIFSLAAVFAACIAWFSTNTIVNNETSDPGINVSYATGNLNYIEFHQLSSTTRVEQVATYHFNKTAYCTLTYNWRNHSFSTTGNSNDCPMGQYTLLDQEHPLLMIIAFHKQVTSQVAGDISITFRYWFMRLFLSDRLMTFILCKMLNDTGTINLAHRNDGHFLFAEVQDYLALHASHQSYAFQVDDERAVTANKTCVPKTPFDIFE